MKILKFYTTYCSQCKQQTKLLNGFTDAEVVEIDCDENEDLVDKYEVRGLPTIVLVDSEDKVINKFIGITQPNTIKDAINKYKEQQNEGNN